MNYAPSKAKFTAIALAIARRYPFLFPQRVVHLADSADHFNTSFRANKALRAASLFYDPDQKIKLKGLSLIIELSPDEVNRLKEWHERCKAHPFDKRNMTAYYSRSYLSAPRENVLGQVIFDGPAQPHSLDRLECDTSTFCRCILSLVHIPSGSAYLNIYMATRDTSEHLLQRIDVSNIEPAIQFESYNLFNPKNSTWHFSIDNLAEQIVRTKLEEVQNEALRCAKILLSKARIALPDDKFVFKGWNLINDEVSLTFPPSGQPFRVDHEGESEFIYKSFPTPAPVGISSKSIYLDFGERKECYTVLVVNSKKICSLEIGPQRQRFENGAALIFESCMVLALTEHVYAKVNTQRELLETHIGFKKVASNDQEIQKSTFEIIKNLTTARDEILHLQKYRTWICPEDYLQFFTSRLEAIKTFTEKILERAELEYKFINDAIGMKVIRSNRIYSRTLGGFAIVQIILAYFAVDWAKQVAIINDAKSFFSGMTSYLIEVGSAIVDVVL
ncbi:hypothetical protein ACLUS7_05855 [Enterobacterales bacterium BD_CKDN230030183-1A_HGKHYDSX7]